MLATPAEKIFASPDWAYEIKWDGVRALAYIESRRLCLISRNRREITAQYPELNELRLAFDAPVLADGEIVYLDPQGRPSFHSLQYRMHLLHVQDIQAAQRRWPVVFYVFDLLYCAFPGQKSGYNLTASPWRKRRDWLLRRLRPQAHVRLSDAVLEDGSGLLDKARQLQLEGVIAKRLESHYVPRRSRDWLKFKLETRREAVVVGFTAPRGARKYFGALLLAEWKAELARFHYLGSVGTGFDASLLRTIAGQLHAVPDAPPGLADLKLREPITWVKPERVAEVSYQEMTPDEHLRIPVFLGLRADQFFHYPRKTGGNHTKSHH